MTVSTEISYKTQTRHSARGRTCHHFTRYRLTCDEYDLLRTRANQSCQICGVPEGGADDRRLVIDHFRGRRGSYVRGLLCGRCNSVMSCYDGNKPWGPKSVVWKRRAEEYAASSWQTPEDGLRFALARGPIDRVEPTPDRPATEES